MKRTLWLILTFALVLLAGFPARVLDAREAFLGINSPLLVSSASIAVRCPLTVGGSFDAKTSSLRGELSVDPEQQGKVNGMLEVDLRTLETGISLRDTHMRENYLEVQKGAEFMTATLSRIHLEGNALTTSGKRTFRGVLALHGQEREVVGMADIKRSGQGVRVDASFPINVGDFEIASPTYLGVGVRNEVTVAVSFQTTSKRPL